MDLPTLWFVLIAVLWIGYFVLEGFDFGVGMLLRSLSENDTDRRVVINTIGPLWDGNEVWLVVAGGATFAAFPEWYATLFSGFYLPLLAILVALIARGVAFEFRGKVDDPSWRARWDLAIFWGSVVPAFLWGVAFANIVRGVPLDADHEYAGTVVDLITPYSLLGGLTTTALFTLHGAVFVALKTDGPVRARARALARRMAPATASCAAAFLGWTLMADRGGWAIVAGLAAAACLSAAVALVRTRREGAAFASTAAAIALAVTTLFLALWPNVLPADIAANSLTVDNASSTPYTLKVMTYVALGGLPVVLLYQGWTYWIFRQRLTRAHISPPSAAAVPAPRRPSTPSRL